MTKKQIAKEWLYLLGFLFLFLVITLITTILSGDNFSKSYSSFFELLFLPTGGSEYKVHEKIAAWIFTFSPYILFQFVRSIVWACKTVRQK